MNKTAIEWTDYTANPIRFRRKDDPTVQRGAVWACVKASEGCQHCYAETIAKRFQGREFTASAMRDVEPFVDEKELRAILSPKRLPAGSKLFLGDMTDVAGEWVPFELLDRVFAVMALRPDVVFQVLTKRPERMREYLSQWDSQRVSWVIRERAWDLVCKVPQSRREEIRRNLKATLDRTKESYSWPLPNVWLGTSAENQRWADVRIPELLATPAAVRFVSYEPALGPVDFTAITVGEDWNEYAAVDPRPLGLDWVIVGGESGPGARPFDVVWARSTVAQCKAAGVACFVKQLGSAPSMTLRDWETAAKAHDPNATHTNLHLKDRKGGDWDEWPEELRVREMPGAP